MSVNQFPTPSSSDRFWAALRVFFRGLLRLVLVLLVGVLVGGVIYFGFAYVYPRYIFPVQQHTDQIQVLQTSQAENKQQMTDRLAQFQDRIVELEKQRALDAESISELKSQITSTNQTLQDQSIMLKQLDTLDQELVDLSSRIDLTQQGMADLKKDIQSTDSPVAQLKQEIQILKVMQLLTRSKLLLAQNNLGLAQQDIGAALEVLKPVQMAASVDKKTLYDQVAARLTSVQQNLPEYPVVAADDLEIAWQILLTSDSGTDVYALTPALPALSGETISPTPTQTPCSGVGCPTVAPPGPTPGPSATPTSYFSPTPIGTTDLTATPAARSVNTSTPTP